ncbi:MAG TPA: serine/threonine-protein kinase [Verrucomicrobiae bacterium]|nr:serine/threonine-protein kinase [Verrucomicrobiae bacterium]
MPDSINCHACGALLDLAGHAGFTHIECRCGALSVVPLQFGDFLLLSPIGSGAVGTVYKAIDLLLNRYLALKVLPKKLSADPEVVNNFSREARAAAVNHPNVALVYSFGEHDGQYYLAMELLERGSLDDRITKLGKLPEADVLSIGIQIASALRAAARRGLLHRDVKPGNVLFNDDDVPKIVDFGLARHGQGEGGEQPKPVWGTPYYVAPEKLRDLPEDFRSDIYSLGATLFHALAGRPPFDAATTGEVVTKHATQPAFSLGTYAPDVHERTTRVISRMLAKDPAERHQSYDELIQELTGAQALLKAKPPRKWF